MSTSESESEVESESDEELEDNVFASPWKESDVILVVQDTEFHVHRQILALQSPVFKTMFNGNFKEANQKKITLKGKDREDMLQFLKLLYPPSLIDETLTSFAGEINKNVLKMLALADEYQADEVLNQCLKESIITRKNAFSILPYAIKSNNKPIRDKCEQIITERIPVDRVEKALAELDHQVVQELLLKKCRYLELKTKFVYK